MKQRRREHLLQISRDYRQLIKTSRRDGGVMSRQPTRYQLRLNKNYPDLLRLVIEGYKVLIEPGTGTDDDGETWTFKVSVLKEDKLVSSEESHALDDALFNTYTSTPEW